MKGPVQWVKPPHEEDGKKIYNFFFLFERNRQPGRRIACYSSCGVLCAAPRSQNIDRPRSWRYHNSLASKDRLITRKNYIKNHKAKFFLMDLHRHQRNFFSDILFVILHLYSSHAPPHAWTYVEAISRNLAISSSDFSNNAGIVRAITAPERTHVQEGQQFSFDEQD